MNEAKRNELNDPSGSTPIWRKWNLARTQQEWEDIKLLFGVFALLLFGSWSLAAFVAFFIL